MEWVDGARLVDQRTLQEFSVEPTRLVDTLVQCSLRQMLEVGGSLLLLVVRVG